MKQSIPQISPAEKRKYLVFFALILVLFSLSSLYTQFNPFLLSQNAENFWTFLSRDFFPPKLPAGSKLVNIGTSMLVTVAMAIAASTIGAVFAFLVALFASESVSPFPKFAKVVRGFATFLRNIPALVWAFILFSSLGIGTGVGLVALFITSFAFMVRAFAETMDDISKDCLESLHAVGASFPQRVAQGVIPSCISGFISWFLYCLEVNIRASTIVGMVGGGGIGLVLFSYIKGFKYHIAFSIILLIALMVIVVDRITGYLRRELSL